MESWSAWPHATMECHFGSLGTWKKRSFSSPLNSWILSRIQSRCQTILVRIQWQTTRRSNQNKENMIWSYLTAICTATTRREMKKNLITSVLTTRIAMAMEFWTNWQTTSLSHVDINTVQTMTKSSECKLIFYVYSQIFTWIFLGRQCKNWRRL